MTAYDYAISLANQGHTAQSIKQATGVDLGVKQKRAEFQYVPAARRAVAPAPVAPTPKVEPERPMFTKKMLIDKEIERIANKYGVTVEQIYGDRRIRNIAYARQEIYFRIYTHFEMSFPRIGKLLRKNHTTVHHGVRKYCLRNDLDYDRFKRLPAIHDGKQQYIRKPISASDYAHLVRVV